MSRFTDASLGRLRQILERRAAIEIDAPQYRRACVLIPLVSVEGQWSILFSRRSANLAARSGQIAFPGGAVEEGESLEAAAIREAEEEVGIHRGAVELYCCDLCHAVFLFFSAAGSRLTHHRHKGGL